MRLGIRLGPLYAGTSTRRSGNGGCLGWAGVFFLLSVLIGWPFLLGQRPDGSYPGWVWAIAIPWWILLALGVVLAGIGTIANREKAADKAAAEEAADDQRRTQAAAEEQQRRQRQADIQARTYRDVPARDVTHHADGSVSFRLEPPGLPEQRITLKDASQTDFRFLADGDKVSGLLNEDHETTDLSRLQSHDWAGRRWTGWAEGITRHPDGSKTFTIKSQDHDPVPVRLDPEETVRWQDGRPFRMREGSQLTVVVSPDGTPQHIYHESLT